MLKTTSGWRKGLSVSPAVFFHIYMSGAGVVEEERTKNKYVWASNKLDGPMQTSLLEEILQAFACHLFLLAFTLLGNIKTAIWGYGIPAYYTLGKVDQLMDYCFLACTLT